MNTTLTLVSVAFAALAVYLDRPKDTDPPPERNGIPTFLGLTALLIVVAAVLAPRIVLLPTSLGMVAGFAAASLIVGMRRSGLAAYAIGVLLAALCQYLPEARFACLVTLGLGALVLASDAPVYACLGAVAAMAADALGPKAGDTPVLAFAGTLVALGAVLAGLLVTLRKPPSSNWLRPLVLSAATVAAGVFLAQYLKLEADRMVIGIAGLAAFVVHWLVADREDSLRYGVAAVVWIGLGTVAFGLGRGVGMALAIVTASAILSTLGNRAGLLTMMPLVGLVLYRVLRDAQPIAPPVLEATQYNTLVGLVAGAVLPLIPLEWLELEIPRPRRPIGYALWTVLLVMIPITALIVTGSRGVVGLVIGMGVSGLLSAMKGTRSLLPAGIAVALSGVVMTSYGWAKNLMVIERDEKIRLLVVIAVVVVAIGIALAAMTPRKELREEVAQ